MAKIFIMLIIVFLPNLVGLTNSIKDFLIAKGKIIDPIYDNDMKKNYLLFRAKINIIFNSIGLLVLLIGFIVMIIKRVFIHLFAIELLFLSIICFFWSIHDILIGKSDKEHPFYDSKEKKRKVFLSGIRGMPVALGWFLFFVLAILFSPY